MNPLNNDLFEGQNFADKKTAISAIKSNHIKNPEITMLQKVIQHDVRQNVLWKIVHGESGYEFKAIGTLCNH